MRRPRSGLSTVLLVSLFLMAGCAHLTGWDSPAASRPTASAPMPPPRIQPDYGRLPVHFEANHGPTAAAAVGEAYGRVPLHFEPNHGQVAPDVRFIARGQGYRLFL